jgi:predicted PurR-regulated permease PerM
MIVPVLAVYLLYDFDNILAGIRDLIPRRFRRVVTSYARDIDAVLSQFIRGQLIVMGIVAVLYASAYSLLGIRLAIPIGICSGILNFVPYLGSAFALTSGLLMSLIGGGGWPQLLGVVIAYSIVQSLEGFVITPRVVGNAVGLRDVWVLLALFVGGELFGFLGVLLALPAAAVGKIFVARAIAAYRSTELFLAGPPSQAPPPVAVSPPPEPPESSAPPSTPPSTPAG